MTLVLLSVIPLLVVTIALLSTLQGRLQASATAAYADANSLVQETFAAVRTVFACTASERMVQRYSRVGSRSIVLTAGESLRGRSYPVTGYAEHAEHGNAEILQAQIQGEELGIESPTWVVPKSLSCYSSRNASYSSGNILYQNFPTFGDSSWVFAPASPRQPAACSAMQQGGRLQRQMQATDAAAMLRKCLPCRSEAASLQAGCSRNLAVQALVGPEKAGIKGSVAGSLTVASLNGLFPLAWALVSPPLPAKAALLSAPQLLCSAPRLLLKPA